MANKNNDFVPDYDYVLEDNLVEENKDNGQR
jgi:hypothetical protein